MKQTSVSVTAALFSSMQHYRLLRPLL